MKIKYFLFTLILITLCGCSILGGTSTEYKVVYNGEGNKQKDIEPKKTRNDEPYTIGFVPKIEGIPYFNAVREGALEAGKDLGVKIIYKGPSTASWEEQAQIIEGLIESNVDVIAVAANDPIKLGYALQKAKNRGIKVITWDSDTNPEFRSFFVNMVNPEILGRHLMDVLASEMNENGQYVILTGSSTAANLNDWIKWIDQQNIEYYPNMERVDVIPTNEDPHTAYLATQKVLEKYPDLKGIIGISTVNPPVAAQVVKDKGKTGDIKVIGVSSPLLMKPFLKEGVAQMITLWSPQKLGYLTVSLGNNLLNGESPYSGQQIQNIGIIGYEDDMVIMGQPINISKENVDQYDF
ncbi:autoinducer 2 ABC transporter substrate-binding protein [Metabacillus sediminilitoris]|uniref:autoinducer 2 ABC transporter substrate-binding protein n=1 Tax=Metabacillus sediminilitoris TaxID=2567941 RepID=UPI001D0D8B13|nr:autoinducer 2 ABC transporter substrate-binding protein [Metabacillus sediminilitoris]